MSKKVPGRRPRWPLKIIIPVCSVVVGLLLAETAFRLGVYLRLIDYPQVTSTELVHKYADNPELIYDLKPSAATQWQGVQIKINALGLRDYEYPLVKPQGVTRLAVVGDSVAFGGDMEVHLTFAKLLEAQLNQPAPGRFEVLNFAVAGYNSAQEEIVLREKVLRTRPDVVLLAYCQNDDSYSDGLGALAREMHPAAFGSRLHSKLLSYILYRKEQREFSQRNDFKPVVHLIEQLPVLGRQAGFKPVLLIFPYFYHSLDAYPLKGRHAVLHDLAQRSGVAFIDFMDVWGELNAEERRAFFTPDGIHLTPLGMQRVADYLYAHRALYLEQ